MPKLSAADEAHDRRDLLVCRARERAVGGGQVIAASPTRTLRASQYEKVDFAGPFGSVEFRHFGSLPGRASFRRKGRGIGGAAVGGGKGNRDRGGWVS